MSEDMNLPDRLRMGCIYIPKRWSGDCGEMSPVDEYKTHDLLVEAAERIEKLEGALQRIRDCKDCPSLSSYANWMIETAREALE